MATPIQPRTVAGLAAAHGKPEAYAYLDEDTKRNVRRAILKALAIPGWQVPSRRGKCRWHAAGAAAGCR